MFSTAQRRGSRTVGGVELILAGPLIPPKSIKSGEKRGFLAKLGIFRQIADFWVKIFFSKTPHDGYRSNRGIELSRMV